MKYALIDPSQKIVYISAWELINNKYVPILTTLEDSARVAEVIPETFPLVSPSFWAECNDDVIADEWYYQLSTQEILHRPPNVPQPTSPQPSVGGASDV